MKIRVSGTDYDMANLGGASLLDLVALKQKTGMGMNALQENLGGLSTFTDPNDLFDDDGALMAIAALIWLSRRMAGETIGFEESASAPMSEIDFVSEPDDETPAPSTEVVVPDPPSPDSDPVAAPEVTA